MLTIEQLYELYANMGDEAPGKDQKPKNRGFAALKKQAEIFSSNPPQSSEMSLAADALVKLVSQMENAKKQDLSIEEFKKALAAPLKTFNDAYDRIPSRTMRTEGAQLKETVSFAAKESTREYDEEIRAMRDNLMSLARSVKELANSKNVHETTISAGGKVESYVLSSEERDALLEVKVDSLKHQMATIMAMDRLKNTVGAKSAMERLNGANDSDPENDPSHIDNLISEIEASDAFDSMLDRLQKSDLSRDAFAGAFYRAGYEGLAPVFDTPAKRVEIGPGAAPKIKDNSSIKLFKDGLEELKNDIKNSAAGLMEEKITSKEIAARLAELCAIRELGKKEPFKVVTQEDIDKKKKDILNPDVNEKGFKLYRAMLSKVKNNIGLAERVVAGMKPESSLDQFKRGLQKDAQLVKAVHVQKESEIKTK